MATTNSTSKAKTKKTTGSKSAAKKTAPKKSATKKTTTKKSTKTSAAATKAKSTAKKTAAKTKKAAATTNKKAKKSVSKEDVKKSRGFGRLNSLQLFSAGIFALLAIAAGYLMNTASVSVRINYAVPDLIANGAGDVLLPAAEELWTVSVKWLVVVVAALSALFALVNSTRLKNTYTAYAGFGANKLRWIETGLTFSLLAGLVAIVSGIQSFITLGVVLGSMMIYALLAWVTERFHVAKQSTKALFVGTFAVGLIPLLVIGSFAVNTYLFGEVAYEWYVYAAQLGLAVALVAMLVTQLRQIKLRPKYLVNLFVEQRYQAIGLFAKVVVIGSLIAGLAA